MLIVCGPSRYTWDQDPGTVSVSGVQNAHHNLGSVGAQKSVRQHFMLRSFSTRL